ncbi:PRC-barrel domain-containing protein [Roseovarius nanhaiticus]|uniref:PRC-barrel domain-containing protein n=1 Tax=Roseovarius nanhaiticus TaxID=573024 RepID=A0A1N7HNM1_9RHOB|nr:PRC-barrel domain-containing protein [Roseovarius nanhaiticus]SEL38351.1 PRC-barrel domain-containing protein [Roseovarius nanhaiticus]SIS26439.1 PRC-barrel domain-containing protein [Roseovarius nanhaiticus]
MDHSKHTPLRPDELSFATVDGANVYGPDDNHIGDVSHFHGTGQHAQAIVDVGGFLGLGAKPVSLPVSSLNFMRDENGKVHATTAMSKDELKNLPEHNH